MKKKEPMDLVGTLFVSEHGTLYTVVAGCDIENQPWLVALTGFDKKGRLPYLCNSRWRGKHVFSRIEQHGLVPIGNLETVFAVLAEKIEQERIK